MRQIELTNTSATGCLLSGIPTVSLTGSKDGILGRTWQLGASAEPGQPSVPVNPGGTAHVPLSYLRADAGDVPSGGGSPIWVPTTVSLTLPGTHGTLTAGWDSTDPVLRQDTASAPGTYSGPFLPGVI